MTPTRRPGVHPVVLAWLVAALLVWAALVSVAMWMGAWAV